ncbi:MAG: hypothetical protein ACJ761_09610 [Chloroflexota bacterium]
MRSIRFALVLASLAALLAAAPASARVEKLVDDSLTGIGVGQAGMFPNIPGGGRSWVIDEGMGKLWSNGHVLVVVEGLVLGSDAGALAGTNPIPTGRALISCDGGDSVAAMSEVVPFSRPDGDAVVNDWVDLPASCPDPIVFFAGITGNGPAWFARTGA